MWWSEVQDIVPRQKYDKSYKMSTDKLLEKRQSRWKYSNHYALAEGDF